MLADDEVRLPGSQRLRLLQQAREQGVEVANSLLAELAG
jgi:LDH2 family malate/lactate/ureidoglycolate dehydrogenase